MKLINENGYEVKIGDSVVDFRGEVVQVIDFTAPRQSSSTGRVYVKREHGTKREYFPSVIGCTIVP